MRFDPCTEWQGSRDQDGYGVRWYKGTRQRAHRWTWESAFGPIPPGMVVMHRCDNPSCVRLDHLTLGTVADNNADMIAKGRNHHPRGELHGMARLTEAAVLAIRSRRAAGERGIDLAHEFGVSQATISEIHHGTKWSWL